jgi:L-amino acid N-acyltransferase YncA
MADYDIRPYRPGDEEGILATFNVVFAEGKPDFVPRTLDEWAWAFARNPAGQRIWVAEKEGEIVAQCAAIPYRVQLEGEPATITQGVDSMVHPDHRRGLRRPGLFVATARPFFERFGGPGQDALHYGWPVEPAWRIGRTFLGYEIVRTQTIHFRTPPPGPTELPDGVEVIERFDDGVADLYARCSREWGLSVVRDATYLNWRFVDNPRHEYTILGVREDGDLVGYAVYSGADSPRPNSGLLVDWLVPTDRVGVGQLLHDAFLCTARANGTATAMAVFPDWTPWYHLFQEWAWNVYASDYLLIGIVQHPRHDTWWLRRNWWYQLAELDAV